MERWRPISGFPAYEVSHLGRLRRVLSRGGRRYPTPKPIKPKVHPQSGYRTAPLCVGGKWSFPLLSRCVLIAFEGEPPSPSHHAAHGDNDKSNNQLSNLRWATPKENNADKHRHGTYVFGERSHLAKISEDTVREIRMLAAAGWPNMRISRHTGVPRRNVENVVTGASWRQVT